MWRGGGCAILGSIKVPSYRVVVVLLEGLKWTYQSLWSIEPSSVVSHRVMLLPCFTAFSSSVDGQVSFKAGSCRSPLACTAFMLRFLHTCFNILSKSPIFISDSGTSLGKRNICIKKSEYQYFSIKLRGKIRLAIKRHEVSAGECKLNWEYRMYNKLFKKKTNHSVTQLFF